jgi:hypothetical protein
MFYLWATPRFEPKKDEVIGEWRKLHNVELCDLYFSPNTMGTGTFLGVKRPGRGVDHPPPSNDEVEGRLELNIYSPSEHS